MHPDNLINMKDLLAHVYEKFGPGTMILEIVSDPTMTKTRSCTTAPAK